MAGRRRHPWIAQRRRIYIGCEGRTEVEYAAFLQDRVDETHRKFHLVRKNLCGNGNPLAMLHEAVRDRHRQATLGAFIGSAVFLDADTTDDRAEHDANDCARRAQFILIWQRPCGEAFLLEHVDELNQSARNSARGARERFRTVFGKSAPLDRYELRRRFEPKGASIFDQTRVSTPALADLLEMLEL